jgi:hydroxymethylglutaryl-CoA reductase
MITSAERERLPVPRDKEDYYAYAIAPRRREFITEQVSTELSHVAHYPFEPEILPGNIEQFIGVAQVPIGVAGPLLVNGEHAQELFYIPLATTERQPGCQLPSRYVSPAELCTALALPGETSLAAAMLQEGWVSAHAKLGHNRPYILKGGRHAAITARQSFFLGGCRILVSRARGNAAECRFPLYL